jgi:hypothetical protein
MASDQLNHILYLQETVKIECKSIMDEQAKDPTKAAEHQALLNSLFVQSMDLNTRAIVAMQAEKKVLADENVDTSGVESVDEILKSLNCITRISSSPDPED